MPTMSSSSVKQMLLPELLYLYAPAVHHRGNLHWSVYDDRGLIHRAGDDIIVFYTVAESFRSMCAPVPTKRRYYLMRLFDMNGVLAFSCPVARYTAINVWVMQDYEAEVWVLKYKIDASTLGASRQLHLEKTLNNKRKTYKVVVRHVYDMVVLNNECELPIYFNQEYVLRCDIDGKFLGMMDTGKRQYRMSLTRHCVRESIIPIPLRDAGKDEELHSPWEFLTGLL